MKKKSSERLRGWWWEESFEVTETKGRTQADHSDKDSNS